MHSAYCSPTVNTHLAKIINYSNKELARPGTCPAWSGVGVWVAWAQALCSSHCDGWQQLYWRYLAGLYCLQCWKYILLHLILTQEIHDILREFCVHHHDTDAATCASLPAAAGPGAGTMLGGAAAADNVVSGQVSGLSLHQHLGMATITVGIDTSRVYNRCTHRTQWLLYVQ